jgi:hypothetical protein
MAHRPQRIRRRPDNMPNRMIRDWTDSLKFDGISPEAERLFTRLIMKADDYGRFHGDCRLIKSACFPLMENLRSNEIDRWLDELSTRQLILRYEAHGRSILSIVNFGQRLKNSRAKFPPPAGKPDDFLPAFDDFLPQTENFPELPGTSRNFPELPARREEKRIEGEYEVETENEVEGRTPQKRKTPPPSNSKAKPKDVEEALAYADNQPGYTPDVVRHWFSFRDSKGWVDKNDQPIRNWRSDLTAWVLNQRNFNFSANGRNGSHQEPKPTKPRQSPNFGTIPEPKGRNWQDWTHLKGDWRSLDDDQRRHILDNDPELQESEAAA